MGRMIEGADRRIVAMIELEHDAAFALKQAGRRLSRLADKVELGAIVAAHARRANELAEIARAYGATPKAHGDARRLLASARVLLGAPFGDDAIFAAAASIERHIGERYERAAQSSAAPAHVIDLCARHAAESRRHEAWLASRARRELPNAAPPP